MNKYFIVTILLFINCRVFSQYTNKIQIEINYGFNYNPSADDFFETNDPPNSYNFYDKNRTGKISGIEIRFPISNSMSFGLAYDQSVHKKEVNFDPNNIPINVIDFNLRNFYNYYQFLAQKDFKRKNHITSVCLGLYYQRVFWQDLDAYTGGLGLEERNFKNTGLEDGGALLGFQYARKIDTHFYLGVRSRIYSTLSSGANIDGITLTPTLTYHFK
jgi:hypothetical protein